MLQTPSKMFRPDILHITEPFSFGCLTALSNISTATAASGLCHAIAHGTERALPNVEKLFPQGTVFFSYSFFAARNFFVSRLGSILRAQ